MVACYLSGRLAMFATSWMYICGRADPSYMHMCAPDEPLDSGHPFRIMLQGIGIITLINTS